MRGLGIIGYGTEGVGKTTWLMEWARIAPLTIASIRETGYQDLTEFMEPNPDIEHFQIENWTSLIKAIKGCPERSTFGLDTLSGLQQILFEHVCRTCYAGDWEKFTSYWKGQRVDSPKVLDELFTALENARNRKVNIVLLGHAKLEESVNTIGANCLVRTIDLDKEVLAMFRKWAQGIMFMALDTVITVATEVDKASKVAIAGKAKDMDNRVMYVQQSPGHSAKHRNLFKPDLPLIRMGGSSKEAFLNFYKQLPEAYRKAWPLKAGSE